jgi:hypothetical protein
MVEKGVPLNITDPKIAEILDEMKRLQPEEHQHACAVLLRVFLELSVDDYLTKHGISLDVPNPNGKTPKKLAKKVAEAIAHLVTPGGAERRTFKGMERGLTDDKSPLSIDLLHHYVHNRFVKPKARELLDAWDEAQPFFRGVWA